MKTLDDDRARSFRVRPAREDDVSFIVRLHELEHVQKFLKAPAEDDIRRAFASDRVKQFILEQGGEPAGLMLLDYFEDWLVELRRIAVARPGTGLGTFAIRWALDHAFNERGAHRVYLSVAAANERARALYGRLGFVLEGTSRHGFRNHVSCAYEDLCSYGCLATDRRD
ncbi:GNAT family N-acetyltransferase [bacterium]|nr:MAG: GNAT family N-acetyltransferase [bacterium]